MSTPINDGGPAFPTTPRSTLDIPQGGMTLRDWFAGQALAGLLADTNNCSSTPAKAETSYKVADAMLAERTKGGVR